MRAFELQQETWRLSWASFFFVKSRAVHFQVFHLFQGKTRSYFLVVLNLDNGDKHCNMWTSIMLSF